jgi:desulfoferrodoxin (superoxide reductase-like protein)
MFYTKRKWMDWKTVALDAKFIVAKAGFVANSQTKRHYIIWTNMILQVDTKASLCGDLGLV